MLSYRKHSNFVNVTQPTVLMRTWKSYDLLIQCESVCYFSSYPSGRWSTKKSLLLPLCVLFTVLSKKLKIFIVYQLGLVFGKEICQKSKLKIVQVAFWKFQISTGLWLGGEHLRVDALPSSGSRSGRPPENHNWTIVSPPCFLIF